MVEFLKLVQQMRTLQKKYQRTRKGEDLIAARELEQQVDAQVEGFIREANKAKFAKKEIPEELIAEMSRQAAFFESGIPTPVVKDIFVKMGVDLEQYKPKK